MRGHGDSRWFIRMLWRCMLVFVLCLASAAQTDPNERAFTQSKPTIEKALKSMQASMSGRLPVLDGFAAPGEHPLDRFQRAFFQATAEVTPIPSGGSMVRIHAKVTAWYADPIASHSGYQLLVSNGRIESDILDQLATQIATSSPESAPKSAASTPSRPEAKGSAPSAPMPARSFPDTKNTFPSSMTGSLASKARPEDGRSSEPPRKTDPLQVEADSLQEILKNTAHPKNLVAVRKSGTPVVETPSLSAKAQFLASQHDEFELLDFTADWVHVRISGLSRGWIWRNSVEMPEGIPDTATKATSPTAPAADLFRVSREEVAAFPGDWAPLRAKTVKIISVQKVNENAKDTGSPERLEYTKYLLEKALQEITKNPQEVQGVVVIFDSADGGMIAATVSTLQEWKSGKLSDAALWHKCFFDPPETFDSAAATATAPDSAAGR